MPKELPSLADLRRARARRPPRPTATPSLFDAALPAAPAEQSNTLDPVLKPPPSAHAQHLAQDFQKQVYTVGELVRRIRTLVERTHGHITVDGEISNWRPAASGHCYFTLKDGEAQLPIVLFRRQAQLLRFRPKDGDAVRIGGSLSVYESRGQLQLVAETMQQTGLGALLAATQALKDRLRREGLFDNKRPLPAFPRCIGIVTSLRGAALRDIVKVCRRPGVPDGPSLPMGVVRRAAVNLLIYPAAVQGSNCAAEVAAGVRWFNRHAEQNAVSPPKGVPGVPLLGPGPEDISSPHNSSAQIAGTVDVILIARGGGSWEDLHGFNDETLARTIAASNIPVLTGIGHAPDSTIADAAADLCAPTPSAAAELVTAAQHKLADRLVRLGDRLARANRYEILRIRQRLTQLSADAILNRVRNSVARRAQRLDDLTNRAEAAVDRNLRSCAARLDRLGHRLRQQHIAIHLATDQHRLGSLQQRLQASRARTLLDAQNRVDRSAARLEALNPLRVLDRGYALIYGPSGTLLRSAADAPEGASITAQLSKGRLRARVTGSD